MEDIFGLTKPLWEIALRATAVYIGLVLLVRVIPKRNTGHISPNDLLTLIVIGGMATDAIMGGSTSAGDVLLMIAIVIGWGYVFDLLEYQFPALGRLFRDRERLLVKNGRILRPNMRAEMVTDEELWAVFRKEGVDKIESVRSARLEADGEISVIVQPGEDKASR